MKIVDDFLPMEKSELIRKSLLGFDFPWYYNSYVKDPNDKEIEFFQFTHVFYKNNQILSQYLGIIKPIIDKVGMSGLLRVKANLNPYTEKRVVFPFHVDYPNFDGKTAIYYVNTTDAVTIFENGTEINSVQNRLIIFDANILHTGTTCQTQKAKCVINFNFNGFKET